MSDEISQLVEFGLTVLQAKVYVALVRLGTCRASEVSSETALVRAETYRVLRELSAKGLVQRNLGPPSTYSAIAPGTALKTLMEQHKRKIKMLNQKTSALVKLISTSRARTTNLTETLSVLSGHASNNLRQIQMISNAKEDFATIVSKFRLLQLFEFGLGRALISAKRRGIRVRVLAEIGGPNARIADRLARHVHVRRTHGLLFCMDIVDKTEVVFGPAFPETEQDASSLDSRDYDVAVWTRNRRFVEAMYTIFERLWDSSLDYSLNGDPRAKSVR